MTIERAAKVLKVGEKALKAQAAKQAKSGASAGAEAAAVQKNSAAQVKGGNRPRADLSVGCIVLFIYRRRLADRHVFY